LEDNGGEIIMSLVTSISFCRCSEDKMKGMKGVTARIDFAEDMVDYTSTTGEKVTNHK